MGGMQEGGRAAQTQALPTGHRQAACLVLGQAADGVLGGAVALVNSRALHRLVGLRGGTSTAVSNLLFRPRPLINRWLSSRSESVHSAREEVAVARGVCKLGRPGRTLP